MKVNLDDGYSFGLGVFETLHIKNGKAIFLDEHLKRLNDGLKILNIDKNLEKNFVLNEISKINFIKEDEVLKIIVSEQNTIFNTREYVYKDSDYKRGYNIKISEIKRNDTSPFIYIKSLNYAENIFEKRKYAKKYDDVLFLNLEGNVCECATSNLFYVKDNKIFTPKLESGLLNGIIRQYILKNYKVREKFITIKELLDADEIFVTNSLIGIMPVVRIEEKRFKIGSVTMKILADYKEYINNKYKKGEIL